ncbi:GIY-YIG nuclease family protein [Bacillus sonorensis]|nr:GIY-YIG nuclease family protein [Bacillus sonorensis]
MWKNYNLLEVVDLSGKLIRLFLVDGNPNGLRTVEISNMTIYTTVFPRAKLKTFLQREESKKAGCYILIGNDIKNPEKTKIYIGEGENVGNRLKSHALGDKQKEFWNEVIVFTSKDDYITKTQIQYLESELCRIANESGNVILDNGNRPSKPNLSEVDNAEMKQFLDAINLILSSIGIDVLESKKVVGSTDDEKVQEKIYEFSIKGAKAKMKIEEDKYIVLKGSTAVVENRPSAGNAIIKMRNSLIEDGVVKLMNQNEFYQFEEDFIFKSPSYAAAAISGEKRMEENNGNILVKV